LPSRAARAASSSRSSSGTSRTVIVLGMQRLNSSAAGLQAEQLYLRMRCKWVWWSVRRTPEILCGLSRDSG
jgi:hypothetical protein